MTGLDALAIGPHPDDIELFCGGTLIRLVQLGHRVGVVDLTAGELASNGSADQRRAEAEEAAAVIGLTLRENLGLPDGGLQPGTDETQVARVAEALRRLRPEIVLAPWIEARHPDHAAAGRLVERSAFLAGLRRYGDPDGPDAHRPRVLFYQMRHRFRPSFIVDTSAAAEAKRAAILCHRSQVRPPEGSAATLVGAPAALASVEARDRYYGSFIGVEHGEPFLSRESMGLADPVQFFRDSPSGPAFAFESQS